MATKKGEPKKEKKPKLERFKTETGTVESFIADGFAEITSVGEEFREAYDNAPESLQQSQVNQTRDETASEIEGFSEPSVESSILGELECSTSIDQGKTYRGRQSQSRACRASNGAGMLRAAAEAISAWVDENDEVRIEEDGRKWVYYIGEEVSEEKYKTEDAAKEALNEKLGHDMDDHNAAMDEAEGLAQECEEIADNTDGLEFPGMFG